MKKEFAWNAEQVMLLFDFMMNGYPIGSLTLWDCPGTQYHEVLDGSQRIQAIYAVLSWEGKDGNPLISYCPLSWEFSTFSSEKIGDPSIWIGDVSEIYTTPDVYKVADRYGQEARRNVLRIYNLRDYNIPVLDVTMDADITEIRPWLEKGLRKNADNNKERQHHGT
ncbi:MAG: DUF262 domain-containing protein [Phascolarctobacterium sp.]|nr:DUF262 domain-containing protein [Phascolarctobacterium sp.]